MNFRQEKKNNKKYLLIVAGLLFSTALYEQKSDTVFASELGNEAAVVENSANNTAAIMETPPEMVNSSQESVSIEEPAITIPSDTIEPEETPAPQLPEKPDNSLENEAPVVEDEQDSQNEEAAVEEEDTQNEESAAENEDTQSELPVAEEDASEDTTDSSQAADTAVIPDKKEPTPAAQAPVKKAEPQKAAVKTAEIPTKARATAPKAPVQDVPIFRIYNPNSGEHFYTMNGYERDMLSRIGWRYEGIGWRSVLSGIEVFRLYNPNSGEHFYTMNGNERDNLKGHGWRYEGIGWHTLGDGMPVYRVYNPNGGVGAHHYTVNGNERDHLTSVGWRYEGIGWYSTPFQPESVVQWASGFFGITRDQIVNELSRHENDRYYLYTPFRGLSTNASTSMSPNGDPNGSGPGMNCTGFIASVIQRAGGNLGAITNVANAWGGVGNGYNWRDALTKNVQYETYGSVSSLLQSGLAKKGDILYFEPDYSQPNYDCHLGFFWGNTPNHDRIWHSTFPHNNMSNIKSMTPWTKIYLFRQG